MLSFLLVGLYTSTLNSASIYGEITVIMSIMVFLNVFLSYGMETAFFRFLNSTQDKLSVIATSTYSLLWSSILFLVVALLGRHLIANWLDVNIDYVTFAIWILVLDALVVIPFSRLRADQRPIKYAIIKIGNVVVNLGLNLFFLLALPAIAEQNPDSFLGSIYQPDFQAGYIFLSNLIASLLTFFVLSGDYFNLKARFNWTLWSRMMRYGLPILLAGIAFSINEHFDKILLERLLPANIAKTEVGIYAACYKIGLFMTLYSTAFRLGIEPFFFSHASDENAPKTYAQITKYFVVFGCLIMLAVVVFSDVLKLILLQNPTYWEAMGVVPLIILANFCLGIYTNLSVWYKLIDKTMYGAYISFVGAALTLGLNFLLIPSLSYYGSAIATLVAYGGMMLISWYWGSKRYPIPYDLKNIMLYLSLSIAASVISFYFYRDNIWVGLGLLLAFTAFVFVREIKPLLDVKQSTNTN